MQFVSNGAGQRVLGGGGEREALPVLGANFYAAKNSKPDIVNDNIPVEACKCVCVCVTQECLCACVVDLVAS